MLTRRDWLRFGAAGCVFGPALVRAGDEGAKPAGKLFLHGDLAAGAGTINGTFAVDVGRETWEKVADEGNPTARVAPDGRRLAVVRTPRRGEDPSIRGVWVYPIGGEGEPRKITEQVGRPFWSADGKQLIISGAPSDEERDRFETWRIDADGSNKARLPFAETDLVLDWSPDGEWLLVSSRRGEVRDFVKQPVYAVHPDGTGERLVTPGEEEKVRWRHRFAENGRRVTYFESDAESEVCTLQLADLDGSGRRTLVGEHDDLAPFGAVWAPDGSRAAVLMFDRSKGEQGKKNDIIRGCRVELVDPDGRNGRLLGLPPGGLLYLLDWR